jgi:hypothetical protein
MTREEVLVTIQTLRVSRQDFFFKRYENEWKDASTSWEALDDEFIIFGEDLTVYVSGEKRSAKYRSFDDAVAAADGFMRDFEDD